MGEIPWPILISILHRWVQYLGVDRTDPWGPGMEHPPLGRSYLVVESSCYMASIIVTCKRNSSAAAKYELCILLPAEQCCSRKCAASWHFCLPLSFYIYNACAYVCQCVTQRPPYTSYIRYIRFSLSPNCYPLPHPHTPIPHTPTHTPNPTPTPTPPHTPPHIPHTHTPHPHTHHPTHPHPPRHAEHTAFIQVWLFEEATDKCLRKHWLGYMRNQALTCVLCALSIWFMQLHLTTAKFGDVCIALSWKADG